MALEYKTRKLGKVPHYPGSPAESQPFLYKANNYYVKSEAILFFPLLKKLRNQQLP